MQMDDAAPRLELADVDDLVGRFPPDPVLVVPATAGRFYGRGEIVSFLSSPAGGELVRLALVETRANCDLAFAVYRHDTASGEYRAYGIFVVVSDFALDADVIAFPDPQLFRYFRLPDTLGQCPTTKP